MEIHFEFLLCLKKGIQHLINVIKKEIVHEENSCCGFECNKAFLEHFFVIIRRKAYFFKQTEIKSRIIIISTGELKLSRNLEWKSPLI